MTPELVWVGLLFATVLVVALGDRFGLPWPALMVLIAAGAAFIPGATQFQIPPDIIVPIFMPPLLWALARKTSWPVIRSQRLVIVSLSVLLVFFTIAVLANLAMLVLPGIGLSAAILLASALAPPDPVAIDAVAGPVGIPPRITTTLQTEGLFNDAASIVTFNLAMAAVTAGSDLSISQGILGFGWSVLAAVILGLLVGRFAAFFASRINSVPAQVALTWVLPFATYLVAEHIHGSGVIAIVVAAVEMRSRAPMEAENRLSGDSFWETVEILFTGVAFGLIGLSVSRAFNTGAQDLWHAVLIGLFLSVGAILVRFIWLYFSYRLNLRSMRVAPDSGVRLRAPLNFPEVVLMTWSGMRGLVTLALILSIPAGLLPLHEELPIIALTFLLCTMVIPALTLPALFSKLHLDQHVEAEADAERAKLYKRVIHVLLQDLSTSKELSADQIVAIKHWVAAEMHVDSDQQRHLMTMRSKVIEARIEGLEAAQKDLLEARQEPGINPVYVDEALAEVDRMLITSKRMPR